MLCRPMSSPSMPHKLFWGLLLRFPSCEAWTHFHYFGAELISAVFLLFCCCFERNCFSHFAFAACASELYFYHARLYMKGHSDSLCTLSCNLSSIIKQLAGDSCCAERVLSIQPHVAQWEGEEGVRQIALNSTKRFG